MNDQTTTLQSSIVSIALALALIVPYGGQNPTIDARDAAQTAADAGMVRIPSGAFDMGCSGADPYCLADEKPLHRVVLKTYWIDRLEVTNGQYEKCVAAGRCTSPASASSSTRPAYYGNPEFADYPVVNVNWVQAAAYCAWAGKRLPIEAEWEKAARGFSIRPAQARIYPWGDGKPDCQRAHFALCGEDTDRVGNHPDGASRYGVLDMAGNVWEWTADWYQDDYYAHSPRSNPTGAANGVYRVVRGGSWGGEAWYLRVSNRGADVPGNWDVGLGFRCAR